MIEKEKLVGYNTYAKLKGVTKETVRKWAVQGKIDAIDIDGRHFVQLTEVELKTMKQNGK